MKNSYSENFEKNVSEWIQLTTESRDLVIN